MIRFIGLLLVVILLSACGFHHRRYTTGYYGHFYNPPKLVNDKVWSSCNNVHLPILNDTVVPPIEKDTLQDSTISHQELLNEWEGDRLIKNKQPKDSTETKIPILDKDIEWQANSSLISGHIALWAPVAGVIIPYLINAAIPNNGSLGLLVFSLYAFLQMLGLLAILVGAVNGYKATKKLESNGLAYVFSEVYEKARRGKKLVMIAMAIRLGIVLLSTIGFLILISYFIN